MEIRKDMINEIAARIISGCNDVEASVREKLLRNLVNGEIWQFELNETEQAELIAIVSKEFGISDLVYVEPQKNISEEDVAKVAASVNGHVEHKYLNLRNAMAVGAVLGAGAAILKEGANVINAGAGVVGAAVSYGVGYLADKKHIGMGNQYADVAAGIVAGGVIGGGAVFGAGFVTKRFFSNEEVEVVAE